MNTFFTCLDDLELRKYLNMKGKKTFWDSTIRTQANFCRELPNFNMSNRKVTNWEALKLFSDDFNTKVKRQVLAMLTVQRIIYCFCEAFCHNIERFGAIRKTVGKIGFLVFEKLSLKLCSLLVFYFTDLDLFYIFYDHNSKGIS